MTNQGKQAGFTARDKRKANFIWIDSVVTDMRLNPYEFRVYCHITLRAGKRGRCWQSLRSMCQQLQMSVNTARKAISKLIDLRMVEDDTPPKWVKNHNAKCYALTDVDEWIFPEREMKSDSVQTKEKERIRVSPRDTRRVSPRDTRTGIRVSPRDTRPTIVEPDPYKNQIHMNDSYPQPGVGVPSIPQEKNPSNPSQELQKVESQGLVHPDTFKPSQGPKSGKFRYNESHLRVAEFWARFARSETPSIRVNPEAWANESRLLEERDGVTIEDQLKMLQFVAKDDFWRPNAVSLMGLRKNGRNGLRKFENIRNAMRNSSEARFERAVEAFVNDEPGPDWVDSLGEEIPF